MDSDVLVDRYRRRRTKMRMTLKGKKLVDNTSKKALFSTNVLCCNISVPFKFYFAFVQFDTFHIQSKQTFFTSTILDCKTLFLKMLFLGLYWELYTLSENKDNFIRLWFQESSVFNFLPKLNFSVAINTLFNLDGSMKSDPEVMQPFLLHRKQSCIGWIIRA